MSHLDLFHFLEPIYKLFGEFEDGTTLTTDYGLNDMYSSYDYSLLIGQGLCTPNWFPQVKTIDIYENFVTRATGFRDCSNLNWAITQNIDSVRQRMAHSVQPVSPEADISEVIRQVGLEKVTRGLGIMGEKGATDVLLERSDARILYCASNLETKPCSSVRTVPSTDGYSIGVNMAGSVTVDVEEEGLGFSHFMKAGISM